MRRTFYLELCNDPIFMVRYNYMLEVYVELGPPFNKLSHQNRRNLPDLGRNIISDYEPPVEIDVGVDGITIFHPSLSPPKHQAFGGRRDLRINVHIEASIPGRDERIKGRDFTVVVTNS